MSASLDPHQAYKLGTTEDHRRFYAEQALSYDQVFVEREGYVYPRQIAGCYAELACRDDVPIADLGCGTGLIGNHLKGRSLAIDGFDLSTAMLSEAARKDVYRHLHAVNLKFPVSDQANSYGALLSSGTFTLGHLGPNALANCLDMARSGALCVIGINAQHFDNAGFGSFFESAEASARICQLSFREARIYDQIPTTDRLNSARVAVFRTL